MSEGKDPQSDMFLANGDPVDETNWFLKLYELFEPVREGIAAAGMTEEEVDAILDESLEEVRLEHYLKWVAEQQSHSSSCVTDEV
jgi:hypothetical protein